MEEARRLLERLERIEQLDRRETQPGLLLGELRGLLVDAEAWVRAERPAGESDAARSAVERCREALQMPGNRAEVPKGLC